MSSTKFDGFDLVTQIKPFLDKNGMVIPQADWSDSGNGILYSAIFIVLMRELKAPDLDRNWFEDIIQRCTPVRNKKNQSGLLMRTPKNDFGLNQFDDYLGAIVASIAMGNKAIPRSILWYGITHLGFYNNTDEFTWKAFQWRFPHIQLLLWCASFPLLTLLVWPVLWLLSKLMSLEGASANQVQLTWVYLYGCNVLGFRFNKYDEAIKKLPDAFDSYYSKNHPFIEASRQLL